MEINVKMTTDEFMEFVAWQKDRDQYERKRAELYKEVRKPLENMANMALKALHECGTAEVQYEIVDHREANHLYLAACDVFA